MVFQRFIHIAACSVLGSFSFRDTVVTQLALTPLAGICERSHVRKPPGKYNNTADDLGCLVAPLPLGHSRITPPSLPRGLCLSPSSLAAGLHPAGRAGQLPAFDPSTSLAPTCVSHHLLGDTIWMSYGDLGCKCTPNPLLQ